MCTIKGRKKVNLQTILIFLIIVAHCLAGTSYGRPSQRRSSGENRQATARSETSTRTQSSNRPSSISTQSGTASTQSRQSTASLSSSRIRQQAGKTESQQTSTVSSRKGSVSRNISTANAPVTSSRTNIQRTTVASTAGAKTGHQQVLSSSSSANKSVASIGPTKNSVLQPNNRQSNKNANVSVRRNTVAAQIGEKQKSTTSVTGNSSEIVSKEIAKDNNSKADVSRNAQTVNNSRIRDRKTSVEKISANASDSKKQTRQPSITTSEINSQSAVETDKVRHNQSGFGGKIRDRFTTRISSSKNQQSINPVREKTRINRPVGKTAQRIENTVKRQGIKNRLTNVRRERAFVETDRVVRVNHYEHVYRDSHDRICHRIIWPKYNYIVQYYWGPYCSFRYVYPYYHRKYIFISFGGYWPVGYNCMRYYWYDWHPYSWYGYYPIAREVEGDTYNYYTYNYYGDAEPATGTVSSYTTPDGIKYVDENTFADVRAKLQAQTAKEPADETVTDRLFDEAVKSFEKGDYKLACDKLTMAIELEPTDMILPYAYAQTLFAQEQYTEAAKALRSALAKVTPEKEGVFYPRGLYDKEETLYEQIYKLADRADLYPSDADLQLLLGYQLLGIGEYDLAREPLVQAKNSVENGPSAHILLELANKLQEEKPKSIEE